MAEFFGDNTFADEAVSDADLGMDGATAENTGNAAPEGNTTIEQAADAGQAQTQTQAPTESGTEGGGGDGKTAEGQAGEQAGDPGDAGKTKPPKGLVPIQALHEARAAIKRSQDRIALLEQQIKSVPQAQVNPDFKVLNREEMTELAEEDPAGYAAYMHDFMQFQQAQMTAGQQNRLQTDMAEAQMGVVNASWQAMRQTVPDLFTPEGGFNQEKEHTLVRFAEEGLGMDRQTINTLTNPATRILTPDGKVVPLGLGAASVVQMLHLGAQADVSAMRAQIEAELRPALIKELTQKFKNPDAGGGFQSLSSVPGQKEKQFSGSDREDDWFGISAEEEERLLRGH